MFYLPSPTYPVSSIIYCPSSDRIQSSSFFTLGLSFPAQVTAQIFWLKNRKPEQWRDKQEVTDTSALEKLDAILAENIKNANRKAE